MLLSIHQNILLKQIFCIFMGRGLAFIGAHLSLFLECLHKVYYPPHFLSFIRLYRLTRFLLPISEWPTYLSVFQEPVGCLDVCSFSFLCLSAAGSRFTPFPWILIFIRRLAVIAFTMIFISWFIFYSKREIDTAVPRSGYIYPALLILTLKILYFCTSQLEISISSC